MAETKDAPIVAAARQSRVHGRRSHLCAKLRWTARVVDADIGA